MKNLQRYLQDVANARRRELIPFVFSSTDAKVQTGPFKGMIITPHFMWGDGDIVGKLLGVYEDELHPYVEQAIKNNPDAVINVGCAEGYYSVGFAKRLPNTPVIAVDVEPAAAIIVTNNSSSNNLSNVTAITQLVDTNWLEAECSLLTNPLLIFDCEGAELPLLDPDQVPALSHCSILVECHDCIVPGITETLIERFSKTHKIQSTEQTTKDPYQFEFLKNLSDCDKWALIHEGRPSTMIWLYMVPA
jgi:predicted RNA methylase